MKPLLIIDEADKLRPAALRSLIPLYNNLEGQLGLVIMGTDNLEKEIKRGVKFNQKGMDEIDSRFGRNFIHLMGATKNDVVRICEANGITDKALAAALFKECEPRQVQVQGQHTLVIEDLRRLKRCVEREQLRMAELPAA
jgi:type II secretory pathway predicted ATPase ExeA